MAESLGQLLRGLCPPSRPDAVAEQAEGAETDEDHTGRLGDGGVRSTDRCIVEESRSLTVPEDAKAAQVLAWDQSTGDVEELPVGGSRKNVEPRVCTVAVKEVNKEVMYIGIG